MEVQESRGKHEPHEERKARHKQGLNELLEMKNNIPEMKNTSAGVISRLETIEEKISELEAQSNLF